MLVSGFMVPLTKAFKCEASNTVREVLNLLMDNHVSSLVIVLDDKPTGIVTKTDMCWCYHNGIPLESQVGDVMPWTSGIKRVKSTMDRDNAAKFFEKNKLHHALVEDGDGKLVGLISALDIAFEVAKDARAWPWNRHEDGRVHQIASH
mmetsp:Transcript_21907/g.46249  ORF Transcript_21907/g.46249 Transcript_21907/m.46249 type:complete len:148 (+) Transcript_21907:41-484(+)